eukprot:Hpha_TRINITY_DN16680_c2_g2::TRINITY_DN16680_c2_g2_i1::g.182314::m.182314/K17570/HYDIN; hydrocephalus-inducing protein
MAWSSGGAAVEGGDVMLSQEDLTFVVTPPRIVFRGYEPFKTYETPLQFKNQTKQSQSVRVIPPESRFFGISEPRAGSTTLRVARGLSVSYTVKFRPEDDCDYDCDLVVVTDKERFVVEVRALASRGKLDFPKVYSFPRTPVKHFEERALFVRNVGAKPAQWTLSATPPWSIAPEVGFLEPGAPPMQLTLTFNPTERRKYEGVLLVSYSNGDGTKVRLEGDAVDVPVTLSKSALVLAPTFISLERQETVSLFNKSDVTVRFQWKAHETQSDEQQLKLRMIDNVHEAQKEAATVLQHHPPKGYAGGGRSSRRRTSGVVAQARELKTLARTAHAKQRMIESSPIAFEHAYFTIEPLNGFIPAKSHREFTVTFNPQMATTCEVIAFIDVVGRETRLPLSLKGQGIGPQCQFSYDALDLGDVFINSIHHYEVILENRGSIEARYALQQSKSLFGPKFRFTPSLAAVPPGKTQTIEIEFCSDIIGILSEAFNFTIQGAKDDLVLHFKGRVIGPTFHCDVDEIDFGNVSYNFMHQRNFNLVNTSEIPMRFHLRVPEDTNKEFDIVPAAGLVLPHGKKKIQLDFLSDTVHEYNAHLVVDIDEVGDALYSVPVKATCIVPDITVTRDALDFGRGQACFVGHPYTMDIEVKNDTQLSCKYEVGLPGEEDPIRRKVNITVNQKKGIVNARSTHQVAVTLTAKMVGSAHLPIYIRVLGSEKRIPVSLSAKVTGPVVSVDHTTLDFGRVCVLDEHCRNIEISNTSPIPALFTTRLVNRTAGFSLKVTDGTIPKHSKFDLPVYASLDDTVRFTDELIITIANSKEMSIKLCAVGTGTTLVPSIPFNRDVDFGNVFTTALVQRNFIMHNKGRRSLQISWSNERPKPKEGEPPFTFTIQPERATIAGKGEQEFVIDGSNSKSGKAMERFLCKLTKTHKLVFKLQVVGTFVVPLLEPSDKHLPFHYNWQPSHGTAVEPMQQSRPLTLRNISPLTLDFSLKAGSPFTIDKTEHSLKEHESCTVYVEFDANYRKDRISHKLKTKLTVSYKDHPQKESVDLAAEVDFPNLQLELTDKMLQQQQQEGALTPQRPAIDFGCVTHETERRAFMTVQNTSKVEAKYMWVFEEPGAAAAGGSDPAGSRPNTEQRKRPVVTSGASSGLFDVLPIRGFLRPGEAERVEFVFHAQSAVRAKAQAVLLVDGGPEYPMSLAGEASTVHFRLDRSALDFGAIPYDRHDDKEVLLHNMGRVSFSFQVDLSGLKRKGVVEVVPLHGHVKAGEKQKLVVRFCPRVPDLVDDCFQVQVSHYEPHSISVRGLGLYPSILVQGSGVERISPPNYSSLLEEARHFLEEDSRRHFLRVKQTNLGNTTRARSNDETAREKMNAEVDSEVERLYFTRLIQSGALEQDTEIVSASASSTETPYLPVQRKMPTGEVKQVVSCYTVDFGAVVKGEARKKTVRVTNISHGPLVFAFDRKGLMQTGVSITPDKQTKLVGHPAYGEQTLEIQLLTKGDQVKEIGFGDFRLTVPVDVKGGPLVTLEIKAFIMVPQLSVIPSVDTPLDFDLTSSEPGSHPFTTVGEAKVIKRQFHNPLPLPCEWSAKAEVRRNQPRNKFICKPDRGVLAPGERCDVEIHFVPSEGGLTTGLVNIKVAQNPKPVQLVCKGTGEAISIVLEKPTVELGPVLPFVSQEREVILRNESQVAVEVFSLNFDRSVLVENDLLCRVDSAFASDGTLLLPPREQLPCHLPDHLLDSYWAILSADDDALAAALDPQSVPQSPPTPSQAGGPGGVAGSDVIAPVAAEVPPGNVVLVWGPPLSGKTTVARAINQRYGLQSILADEALSWVLETDSDEGAHLRNVLAPCDAVEKEELSVQTLADALALRFQEADCRQGVVFDGAFSEILAQAGLDRPDTLAKGLHGAAEKCRMAFHIVVLDIDEGLIELRRAVQKEATALAALQASALIEIPEDDYDAMDTASRRAHEAGLTRNRRCKREAKAATEQRVALEKEREGQDTPETVLESIVREEEARAAAEAEEAASKKKPAAKKGGKEEGGDEPKFEAGMTELAKFKLAHRPLLKAAEFAQGEEEGKHPVVLIQTGPSPGETFDESHTKQVASLASEDGLPFPPINDGSGQEEALDLSAIPPDTKARIERPRERLVQRRPKELTILTKRKRELDAGAAAAGKPGGKAGGAKTPPPGADGGDSEFELVPSVTRWQLAPRGEPGCELPISVRYEPLDVAPSGGSLEYLDFGVVGSTASWKLECRGVCGYPEIKRDMKAIFTRKRQVRRSRAGFFYFDFGPLLVHEPKQGGAEAAGGKPGAGAPKKSIGGGVSPQLEPGAAQEHHAEWITVQNSELFPADIVWSFFDDTQKTFSVVPPTMHLEPGEQGKLKVVCLPEPGLQQGSDHEHTLLGLIKDNPAPVQIPLACSAWRPQVDVEGTLDGVCTLAFGKMLLDVSKTEVLHIRNLANIPLRWELVDSAEPAKKLRQEFKLEPARGVVERKGDGLLAQGRLDPRLTRIPRDDKTPRDRDTISITFEAVMADVMNCELLLNIKDDDPGGAGKVWQTIKVVLQAEAYNIYAEAAEKVVFGTGGLVKVGQEHIASMQVLNKGKYSFVYELQIPPRLCRGAVPLFRCNPAKGELPPREPLKIDVIFNPRREIAFKDPTPAEFEILVLKGKEELAPGEEQVVVGSLPVRVEAEARYNQVAIQPKDRLLDFGAVLFNDKKKITFEIANTGPFEFKFKLYDQEQYKNSPPDMTPTPEPEAPAKGKAPKPAAKKGKDQAAAPQFSLGPFKIEPSDGSIAVGDTLEVSVTFDPAGLPAQAFSEKLGVHVEDLDVADTREPILLQAESGVPGIAADLSRQDVNGVFEDSQVVQRLDKTTKLRQVFAREGKIFSFGCLLLNKTVQESVRIANPFKVPCTVTLSLRGKTDGAPVTGYEAWFLPPPGSPPAAEQAKPMTLEVPPGDFRFAAISFKPTEQRAYGAVFEAKVTDGTDPLTQGMIIELRGEGHLPQVRVDLPTPPAPPVVAEAAAPPDPKAGGKKGAPAARPGSGGKGGKGAPAPSGDSAPASTQLVFPRTVVGKECVREMKVTNVGELPAQVRLVTRDTTRSGKSFTFAMKGQQRTLAPGATENWPVTFAPLAPKEFEAKIAIPVQDSQADEVVYTVSGEGTDDVTTFGGLGDMENLLVLDDCGVQQTSKRTFNLVSQTNSTLRFAWDPPKAQDGSVIDERFKISPGTGWLLPGTEKEVCVSFAAGEAPEEFTRKPFQLSVWPIRSHAKKAPDWDDRQTAVKWEPEETPPTSPGTAAALSPSFGKEAAPSSAAASPAAAAQPAASLEGEDDAAAARQKELARKRRPLRRRIETLPEPGHDLVDPDAAPVSRTLFVKGACGWAKWQLVPEGDLKLEEQGIHFATTKLFQTRSYHFGVKNTGSITLRCQWSISMPSGDPVPDDIAGRFRIEPDNISVPVDGTVQCKVLYSPLDTEQHQAVLRGEVLDLKPEADGTPAPNPVIPLEGKAECPLAHFELQESDYLTADRRNPEFQGPPGKTGPLDKSMRVLEFANAVPRKRATKRFYILNPTSMSYDYEWTNISEDPVLAKMFACKTRRGVVHAMKKSEMVFEFYPEDLSTKECFFSLRIGGSGYFKPLNVTFLLVANAPDAGAYASPPEPTAEEKALMEKNAKAKGGKK